MSNNNHLPKLHFLSGSLYLLVGTLFFLYQKTLPTVLIWSFVGISFLKCVFSLLTYYFRREKDESLFGLLFKTFFWFFLLSSRAVFDVPLYFLALIIAVYQLFLAFTNLVTYYLCRANQVKPRFHYLFDGLLNLVFGLTAFLSSDGRSERQLFLLGGYLILLGFSQLRDAFWFDKATEYKHFKRRWRMSLPIFLTALIPATTLANLNKRLLAEEVDNLASLYNMEKSQVLPQLEVLIHTSDKTGFFGAVGHVDLIYKGKVLAYGAYDVYSERLFGMVGDGVFFKADRESYIKLCKKEGQKTLFAYGLYLTPEQEEAVEKELEKLEKELVPFQPSSDLFPKTQDYVYPYKIKSEAEGETFKFSAGRFKTYFVLSTNCVLLADRIIGRTGIDLISSKGFITPGTYKDYMDREFDRPNSIVVSRKIYS